MQPVKYRGGNSGTGISPGIWYDMQDALEPQDYIVWFEDFLNHPPTAAVQANYFQYVDTNATIVSLATEVGGVIQLATSTTDNCGPVITTGYNVAGMGKITAGKKLAWEIRLRPSTLSTADLFFGLAQEALAVDNGFYGDTDTPADVDCWGFRALTATPTVLNAVYNTNGGGGITVAQTAANTLVAATWVKLGGYFDGTAFKFFVNGVPLVGVAEILSTATNVPDGEEMAFYIAAKNQTTVSTVIDIDWAKVAMER